MFENQYYPTPKNLVDKMLEGIDLRGIKSILEPSAGSGNIVDRVVELKNSMYDSYYSQKNYKADVDTVEIDKNLQHILKGKNYRVVHDNFLSYNTFKKYDLIIANPPFLDGHKHLLKMLEMQKSGGRIICMLNAETLRNPYSVTREDLVRKLVGYNAEIDRKSVV